MEKALLILPLVIIVVACLVLIALGLRRRVRPPAQTAEQPPEGLSGGPVGGGTPR